MKNCRDCIMDMLYVEDCCEILDSMRVPITASEREEGEYPYYGANGIQDHIADYIFDDELVLLAEDGGNFGSRERPIAYRVSGKCWVNNHAHVLKPKTGLDVDYLCYSLMFYKVDGMVNGATRQKLTQAAMRKMQIPLRSMDKQKYIVDVLNHIIKLKERRQQELQLLDDLIKARFVEMFGDPILNPNGYLKEKIEKHIDLLSGYPFKSEQYVEEGINICGGLIIMPQKIKWNECVHWSSAEGFEDYLLNENDIVMALDRPWISEGFKMAKVDAEHLPALLIQRTARIRAIDMNQEYLYNCFINGGFDKHSYVTGSLVPHISAKDIRSFEIMIPPAELQNQFADFVHQVDKSKVVVASVR
nr:MAG TPA: Type I restriction enzyme [Caudoviricetes sp.]